MKKLIIALIAFAIVLGTGVIIKSHADGGIGGYPGGQYTYPHNTGACYCGQYLVCHPVLQGHMPGCTGYQPIPGQLPGGSGPCKCSRQVPQ